MNPRIFAAVVVGGILVVSTLVHTRSLVREAADTPAKLAVGNSLSVSKQPYIKSVDSDGDGVPDWQQALRTSEPIDLTATSTPDTPDTFTSQFSVDFFNKILQAKTYGDFAPSQEDVLAEAERTFAAAAQDKLFTQKDITITNATDAESLRAYGNAVVRIAIENSAPKGTPSEAEILRKAVQTGNEKDLSQLILVEAAYADMIDAMLRLPAPQTLAQQHVDLINAYNAILLDVRAFQNSFNDPMYSLVRLRRYQDDATGMHTAIVNLFSTALENGAYFAPGDIALDLITITEPE